MKLKRKRGKEMEKLVLVDVVEALDEWMALLSFSGEDGM